MDLCSLTRLITSTFTTTRSKLTGKEVWKMAGINTGELKLGNVQHRILGMILCIILWKVTLWFALRLMILSCVGTRALCSRKMCTSQLTGATSRQDASLKKKLTCLYMISKLIRGQSSIKVTFRFMINRLFTEWWRCKVARFWTRNRSTILSWLSAVMWSRRMTRQQTLEQWRLARLTTKQWVNKNHKMSLSLVQIIFTIRFTGCSPQVSGTPELFMAG